MRGEKKKKEEGNERSVRSIYSSALLGLPCLNLLLLV